MRPVPQPGIMPPLVSSLTPAPFPGPAARGRTRGCGTTWCSQQCRTAPSTPGLSPACHPPARATTTAFQCTCTEAADHSSVAIQSMTPRGTQPSRDMPPAWKQRTDGDKRCNAILLLILTYRLCCAETPRPPLFLSAKRQFDYADKGVAVAKARLCVGCSPHDKSGDERHAAQQLQPFTGCKAYVRH